MDVILDSRVIEPEELARRSKTVPNSRIKRAEMKEAYMKFTASTT